MLVILQNGTGVFTDWLNVETTGMLGDQEESIPGAPAELQLFASSDSVRLNWSPPQHNAVVVRGYMVRVIRAKKMSGDAQCRMSETM